MELIKCFLLITLICALNAQDLSFCDNTPDPANLPFPVIPDNSQYQAVIEKNSNGETEELEEYYDGINNVGITINYLASIKVRIYSYYGLNELLLVSGDNCKVFKLNESYSLSPFQVANINGSEHIISPLNALTNRTGVKFNYVGTDSVRGIPVNVWRACVFVAPINTNIKITVSFSQKEWVPATPSDLYPSVPVEVSIENKDSNSKIDKEVYSVLEFRPFLILQEENYFTPSGIFCPGRTSLKNPPQIPESFMFSSQIVTPLPNQNNRYGTIESVYEEYNLKHKLFRYIYGTNNSINNEIHDYSTGLMYRFNRKSGNCEIFNLTEPSIDSVKNGSYLSIRNPNQFFDFDNADFQYVGLKRRDGVNNDVWIGKRLFNGLNSTFEWYFMSDTWNRSDDSYSKERTPVPIFVKITVETSIANQTGIQKFSFDNHIFGFTRARFNPIDYDISACDEKLTKRYFIFQLKNDLAQLIRSNIHEFENSLLDILQQNARVTLLRISNLRVVFDKDGIYVFFTLYERSSFYGSVKPPKDDLLLEDAVNNLKSAFMNDRIQIDFEPIDEPSGYTLPVVKESFAEIGDYKEGFISINKKVIREGFSGAAVAVVTIVVVVLGIVLGLFLAILQKSKKLNIPLMKMFYNE